MRMHPMALVMVALCWLLPSGAAGQSLFVSAGGFAKIQQAGGFASQSPTVLDQNLSGTTPAFDASVGGTIAKHVAVQLDLAFPQTLKKTFGPPQILPPLTPSLFTSEQHNAYRTRHASTMVGYQTNSTRRTSVAVLGGLMFVQERTHSLTITTPTPQTNPLPTESTITVYRMAPVLGIDVPIRTMSHLAVVPHARIYKLDTSSGTLGLWPGLDLRWTF